jgi:tetratricopeptide (TPR) repeat protein
MMPKFLPPVNAGVVTLNSAWLRNRVAELGLKQWWLAEQVGVDKKTVIRWLHGHVRSIQVSNAQALSAVLACNVDDLTLPRDAVDLATADDQRQAAALLATSSLIDKLGPIGEWDVIESLLKAVAVPDLPLHVLGTIYNRLCQACWRQSKMEEAESYNRASFDVAARCGDKALLAGAHANRANLLHWRGESAGALREYRAALALHRYLDPVQLGGIHNNLGGALYEAGDFEAGEVQLHKALALFRFGGTSMNLSIARCHLAILALRRGDVETASEHAEASEALAARHDYRRGVAMGRLLRAEVAARRGDPDAAMALLSCAKAGFVALVIVEGQNHEFEGRVLRLLGRFDDARAAIEAGLPLASGYPLQLAELHVELAWTLKAQGEDEAAAASAGRAIELFGAAAAPLRAEAVRVAWTGSTSPMSPHVPCRESAKSRQ